MQLLSSHQAAAGAPAARQATRQSATPFISPPSACVASSSGRPYDALRVPAVFRVKGGRKGCIAALAQPSTQSPVVSLPSLLPLDGLYEQRHSFSTFANWLLPGKLMLGRYPFVEPSRCSSRTIGEQQLEMILRAGVTTFVSLQEEIPSQQTMTLAGKNGFLPYKATADLIQAALNGPPPMEIVEGLRNPMLDKFLPPKKAKLPEHQHKPQWPGVTMDEYRPRELQYLHCPIEDLGIPTAEQMDALIADLEARMRDGEVLYVHCWGGRGRAGTVGALLLARAYGVAAEEALQRVQRAFDTRRDNERRSPETDEQHAFVRAYVERLASTRS